MNLSGPELKCRSPGQYPYRFPIPRSVGRLWARESHRRSMYNPHAECLGDRNNPVERTRIPRPGKIWVWKGISDATTVKEHGYLCTRNDDIRGKPTGHAPVIPSELMAPSIGYYATSAIRRHVRTSCDYTSYPWRSTEATDGGIFGRVVGVTGTIVVRRIRVDAP